MKQYVGYNPVINPRGYTKDEYVNAVNQSASVMKVTIGCCHNATYLVLVDAHDSIKSHPGYSGRAGSMFRKVFKEWKTYENNLLYSQRNRFFRLSDMSAEARSRLGNITDREYFEFWQGLGSKMYTETKPLISSLANKFRLSLEHNGVKHPVPLSKGLAAIACLEMSCDAWESVINQNVEDFAIDRNLLSSLLKGFLLRNIADLWSKALSALDPSTCDHKVNSFDEKNISMSINQLFLKWTDPTLVLDSTAADIMDFADIFSSKRAFREAVADTNAMRESAAEELQKRKREELLNK